MAFLFYILGVILLVSTLLNAMALWRGSIFVNSIDEPCEPQDPETPWPSVSLLVPLCGLEEGFEKEIFRFLKFDYPDYNVVFTVLDANDPVIPVVSRIASQNPDKVFLNIGGEATGENLKVRNLLNGIKLVNHEWLIICDGDILPEPGFLRAMVLPFLPNKKIQLGHIKGPVGLVHSLYRTKSESNLAAAWENIWINCDFWVHGLLGDWLGKTDFAFGAAMALHRKTLEEIGGLEVLKDYLADDYQLGNRVSKLGRRIAFSSQWVTLREPSGSFVDNWKHLLRWTRTIRICQPAGFAGSIILNMTLWSLLFGVFSPDFWYTAFLFIMVRMVFAWIAYNWASETDGMWKNFWLVPFKDIAQSVLWLFAFRNGNIIWRGKTYKLLADGKLLRLSS